MTFSNDGRTDETAPQVRMLPARARLGIELRRLRMSRGISQRRLVRLLGLQAHSNLVDYERGRRIPPTDIVVACEKALAVQQGKLRRLHAEALAERAREWSLKTAEGMRGGEHPPHSGT